MLKIKDTWVNFKSTEVLFAIIMKLEDQILELVPNSVCVAKMK
jgi:hypothetical protein